jgi:molecular chaperone IbpA
MATFDFAPMFRSTIGFDQLPDLLAHALERDDTGYPPYNIERVGSDTYQIVMAVAGFSPNDIEIVQTANRITVRGAMKSAGEVTYLYRGLASRAFSREFDLADYVVVTDALLNNGLLVISLKREIPEALKPRTIPISGEGTSPAKSVTFDKDAA